MKVTRVTPSVVRKITESELLFMHGTPIGDFDPQPFTSIDGTLEDMLRESFQHSIRTSARMHAEAIRALRRDSFLDCVMPLLVLGAFAGAGVVIAGAGVVIAGAALWWIRITGR